MRAYSVDLRERVVRSWEKGHGQSWIAREFGIALGSVKRYIKRYQRTGSVKATVQGREKPLISDEALGELQEEVDAQPDATIEAHIELWEGSHGLRVGRATEKKRL